MPRSLSKIKTDAIVKNIVESFLPIPDAILCAEVSLDDFLKHWKKKGSSLLREKIMLACSERKKRLIEGTIKNKSGHRFLLERLHGSEFAAPQRSERLRKEKNIDFGFVPPGDFPNIENDDCKDEIIDDDLLIDEFE